jgi:hypothetical protein
MHRRTFLSTAAGATLGLMASGAAGDGLSTTPRPCPPTRWKKQGVIIKPDEAIPGGRIQNFTCPAEPLDDGRWRIWYSSYGTDVPFNIAEAEGVVGEPFERHLAVLSEGEPADAEFSVGNLPQDWRPVQVVHVPLEGGRHRIYFWAHSKQAPRVVRYLAAESDDGRRYSVLDPSRPCLYHPVDRAVDGAEAAAAGLTRYANRKSDRPPGEPAAPAELISNDATMVYRLPDGTFEMYSVALVEVSKDDPRYIAHDNVPGWLRVIDRYTSEDGLDWGNRQRVIERDEQDPNDQQFYFLSVTHTERGRVGLLGHYRVEAQTMDLEWCFSSDGLAWERPCRTPWLARGEPGEPDCYGIYAPSSMVFHQDRWHLFYTGVNSAHNHKHSYGDPTAVVMLATVDSIWE